MQKPILILFLVLTGILSSHAQKVSSFPLFEAGKKLTIQMEIKNTLAQQAGGQTIDFSAAGQITHYYSVMGTASGQTTLLHGLEKINIQFQGMGQKKSFDSENKMISDDPLDKQLEEILSRKFEIIIDSTGRIIRSNPEKIELSSKEESQLITAIMLKDLTSIVQPPSKGSTSFFSVLPAYPVGMGDTWTDFVRKGNEQFLTSYTLSAISDSAFIIDFKTISSATINTEMMGQHAATMLNSTATGQIIIDKTTGLPLRKTSLIESNGTTEALGGKVPIRGRTEVTIEVR